jgi:hypothetical protein
LVIEKRGGMESFKKRQKEMQRLERQRDKAARRIQRKQNRAGEAGDTSSDDPACAAVLVRLRSRTRFAATRTFASHAKVPPGRLFPCW